MTLPRTTWRGRAFRGAAVGAASLGLLTACGGRRAEHPVPGNAVALARAGRDAAGLRAAPAHSTPSPAAPAAAVEPPPAVVRLRGDGGVRCEVEVAEVLDAHVARGSGPLSPMQEEMNRANPAAGQFGASADHGMIHLACTFRVTVNGAAYRYVQREGALGTAENEARLEALPCAPLRRTAAESIHRFTRSCTDLHAGEYYGDRLEPASAPPASGTPDAAR